MLSCSFLFLFAVAFLAIATGEDTDRRDLALGDQENKGICKRCVKKGCFPEGGLPVPEICATNLRCFEADCMQFRCSKCEGSGCFGENPLPKCFGAWGCGHCVTEAPIEKHHNHTPEEHCSKCLKNCLRGGNQYECDVCNKIKDCPTPCNHCSGLGCFESGGDSIEACHEFKCHSILCPHPIATIDTSGNTKKVGPSNP